jgi:hypothetical protein
MISVRALRMNASHFSIPAPSAIASISSALSGEKARMASSNPLAMDTRCSVV